MSIKQIIIIILVGVGIYIGYSFYQKSVIDNYSIEQLAADFDNPVTNDFDYIYSNMITDKNGVICIGTNAQYLPIIAKFNNSGKLIWQKVFQPKNNRGLTFSNIINIKSGYLVLGKYYNGSDDETEGVLIKYNTNGKVVWQKSIKREVNNNSVNYRIEWSDLKSVNGQIILTYLQYNDEISEYTIYPGFYLIDDKGNYTLRKQTSSYTSDLEIVLMNNSKNFILKGNSISSSAYFIYQYKYNGVYKENSLITYDEKLNEDVITAYLSNSWRFSKEQYFSNNKLITIFDNEIYINHIDKKKNIVEKKIEIKNSKEMLYDNKLVAANNTGYYIMYYNGNNQYLRKYKYE